MLHLPVRQRELLACGREHRLVSDANAVDLGYLVHALLARALGERAAKPFDVQAERAAETRVPGRLVAPRPLTVLAYAADDIATLHAHAKQIGDDLALAAIAWEDADSKPMPPFAAGQRLGFRVRVCPTLRVGKRHPCFEPGAEVDPYLALIAREVAERATAQPGACELTLRREVVDAAPPREIVYRDWLCDRIGVAAAVGDARLASLRDARLWRRGEPGESAAAKMHGRPRPRLGRRAAMGRREAVFEGTLEVRDAGAFRDLLARGVGRHRAFGFGMLLLRSVDSNRC
nr:type I-E CRISPR-associated protein Cas6/Cse3/CasE [uncultured Rhodopila sp.]